VTVAELQLGRATAWARQRGGGDKSMVWVCFVRAGSPRIWLGEGRRAGEGG
jgi:hypothetical protein